MIKKPLLAATIETPDDLDLLDYPVYVSPKIDGIRCVVDEAGVPHTRKGELFPNPLFKKLFPKSWALLDGEVSIGDPTESTTFAFTNGWLKQEVPEPLNIPITFYVFDKMIDGLSFDDRWWKNKVNEVKTGDLQLVWVPQILCYNRKEVEDWEEKFTKLKWEGICTRKPSTVYKHGRSTLNSQELTKMKRFADSEGIIIGFVEQTTNTNEKTRDALGNAKRSSAKAGKVPNGHMGKMILDSSDFEEAVYIGTGKGLTKELRKYIWEHQDEFIGRKVTYWHQAGSDYVKPRIASFKAFRDID